MSESAMLKFGDLLASSPEYGANATALPPDSVSPRYLRITDIDDAGHLLHDDVKSISAFVAKPYLLFQNDIVIARTGNTVGKSYIHEERNGPLAFAGYLVRFRIDPDKAEPQFIFQFLHSPNYYAWVQRTLRTGAQPNINAAEYKKLTIPAFSPSQQRRIAEILATVDEAIEQTEALVQKWQQMKAGLMHDLFTRGVTPDGQLRPTRQAAPQLYKPSPLGWIPKEWDIKTVGELGRIKGGKRLPAGTPFAGQPTQFPYLRVTDMVDGWIDDSALEYVDAATERLISSYKIFHNDIYVTIAGTLGQFGRIPEHLSGAQLTENAARISEIDQETIGIDFLCAALRSDLMEDQKFAAIGVGAGVPKLALYQIERFKIPVPPLKEQQAAEKSLSAVSQTILTSKKSLTKLRAQKQGLMQDLLTGRVPVKIAAN